MNRYNPKSILLILIISALPASLYPQASITITAERALEIAFEENLEVKKQTLDYNAALRRYSNRYSVFLPSLVTSGGFYLNNQDPFWRASFSAYLSLGLGMDQFTALKESKITQGQAQMDYLLIKERLSRDIKKLFYKLLLQREQELLLIQNIDSAKDRYEAAQVDYSRGKISEYELLSTKLSYLTILPDLEEFRITNRNEKARFLRLLGLPGDTDFSLQGSLEVGSVSVKEEELTSLLKEHASLLKQNLLIQQRTLAIRQLQNRYFPRITLGITPSLVFPSREGVSPLTISGGSGGSYLSVTVSADLVDFIPLSAQRERIKTAEESLEKSRIDLDYLLQEGEATVANLLARIRKAEGDIEVYTLNLEVAEEFYRIALTEYNYGRQDLLALQDADVRRQKARVDLLSRKASLIDLIIDLEYWIGKDLF